ncbi:MAG: MBL fold metallo-hydrolase [Ignavibacteria bacterium]|nr:MBL fold metallo-hydrolase [Ignavibacteria bacterium]
MFFKQIYEPGLAHASYIVGCQKTGQALVIDAKRDVDTYIQIAKQEGLRITHITETHIHADFLSGSRELAELTGAPMLLSNEGGPDWQYAFAHEPLNNGSQFMVGNIKFDVVHTPGHTPEHISFLVTDTPAIADVPIMFFSGDFVFVGDVGRPDLLEKAAGMKGTMELGARQMWNSLAWFKTLPDHIQVHPAHGAGSACGKALGAIPSSTVGYEKLVNWALQYTNEEEFVRELLSGQPEPPTYFAAMKRLNKELREVVSQIPTLAVLSPIDIEQMLSKNQIVIDSRSKKLFAEAHISGSINIQNNKAFSTWAGWMLNYEVPFALVVAHADVDELQRKLMRIGHDSAVGYIPSLDDWQQSGHPTSAMAQITHEELLQKYTDSDTMVIDVRGFSEHVSGHIPGSTNIHAGHLMEHLGEIPKDKTVVISCQSGDRSSIATSALMRKGFTNLVNYAPGFAGWAKSGAPVEIGNAEVESL